MNYKTLRKGFLCALIAFVGSSFSALGGQIADTLKGDLFLYEKGELKPYDESKLDAVKVYGLYFSASWCGPCRRFTPKLVSFYNRAKKDHPEFEVVFLSHDRSRDAMLEYLKEDKMAWPTTEFGKGAGIRKYSNKGIPRLVIVDENGTVLADSYDETKYLGADHALDFLKKYLAKNKSETAAKGTNFSELLKPKLKADSE